MLLATLITRCYLWIKTLVFILIAVNAAIFSFYGTVSATIDTVAWLTLLALFELETAYPRLVQGERALRLVHLVRLAAGAGVCIAAAGYVLGKAWLDAINIGLWIGIVILLEVEVRFPDALAHSRLWFGSAGGLLYGGLAVMVGVWAWRGEWFDAYDALLWLIAFLAIEMNVLKGPTADHNLASRP